MEAAYSALYAEMRGQGKALGAKEIRWEDSLSLLHMSNLMMVVGVEMRTLLRTLPEALKSTQPEAAAQAEEHFSAPGIWWRRAVGKDIASNGDAEKEEAAHAKTMDHKEGAKATEEALQEIVVDRAYWMQQLSREAMAALRTGQQGDTPSAAPKLDYLGNGHDDALPVAAHKSFGAGDESARTEVVHVAPQADLLRLLWFRFSEATGIRGWHVVLSIQTTVVFIIAALFTVFPTLRHAFGDNAFWVMSTIFVLSDVTAGNLLSNCFQRILGSAVGCSFSICTALLAYAINGCSSANTAGKLITTCVLVTLFCGFCVAERSRRRTTLQMFYTQALVSLL